MRSEFCAISRAETATPPAFTALDGATIMLVTHDAKVAARCTRVLYIVDGNIKGEYELGPQTDGEAELKVRERNLTNWLMEMGW